MNSLIKGSIVFSTIAGGSGIGYGIYRGLNTNKSKSLKYSDLLKGTLLGISKGENQNEWTARLKSLQTAKPEDLIPSLKLIKDKSQVTWTELQGWCKENINNENKLGKEFNNIESYCTFWIKEKLTKAIESSSQNSSWQKGHDALKLIEDSDLPKELKAIKNKQTGDEANGEIKKWCSGIYEKPFKGSENLEFKNASKICVSA